MPFDTEDPKFGVTTTVQFDGSGPVKDRQDSPHAHFTSFTPDGKLMIVDDLGTDQLHVFPLDDKGYPVIGNMADIDIAP